MRRILSLILIIAFSVTYIGSAFAVESAGDVESAPAVEAPATTMAAPGSPMSPESPPMTQMNSAGLSEFQNFSDKVVDDRVDLASGSLVINQTDFALPGRNGLHFLLARTYNSRQFSISPKWMSPAEKQRIELINQGKSPKDIVNEEAKGLVSDAWGGWIGHGWYFPFTGKLRAIIYDKQGSKDDLPESQVIVQYNGKNTRFEGNGKIFYPLDKGAHNIVKATEEGFMVITNDGTQYHYGVCSFDKYYGFEGDDIDNMWLHDKSYFISKVVDTNGNSIEFHYEKFGSEGSGKTKKKHEEKRKPTAQELKIFPTFYHKFDVWNWAELLNPFYWILGTFLNVFGQLLFWEVVLTYYEVASYHSYPYRLAGLTDTCDRSVNMFYRTDYSDNGVRDSQIDRIDFVGSNGISFKYKYDSHDNLIEVIPPLGNSSKYSYLYHSQNLPEGYDDEGHLLSLITYPTGANIGYSYRWYNPIEDELADTEDFKEGADKDFSYYTVVRRDVAGSVWSYDYSGGKVYSRYVNDPKDGTVWSVGNVSVRDPLGRESLYSFEEGLIKNIVDPLGYSLKHQWQYKWKNLLKVESARAGKIMRKAWDEYDGFGNFRSFKDSGDTATLSDDRIFRSEYLHESNSLYFDKHVVDRKKLEWVENQNKRFREISFEYDPEGKGNLLRRVEKSGSGNAITQYQYDLYGNVIKEISPNGDVAEFEYGKECKSAYMTKLSKLVGGDTLVSAKSYNFSTGLLNTETDFNGNTAKFGYDKIGRMSRKINPDGSFLKYSYNDSSNEIVVTNEKGSTTTYKYDQLGRIAEVQFPDREIMSYQYNAVSKISSITDRAGRKTSYSYDDLDRIESIIFPDGSRIEYSYDDSRGATIVSDSLGNSTDYKYDNFGNLVDVKEADGYRALYDYNPIDNLVKMTDPRMLSIKYLHDAHGKLLETKYADGSSYQFEYDRNGNPISKRDANGQRITYAYDELGRVTKSEYSNPAFNATRFYDENSSSNSKGLLSRVNDPSGTTSYNYDVMGRITETLKTIGSSTYSTQYSYDAVGNLLSVKDPVGGLRTYYEYDELNRVVQVRRDKASGGQVLVASYSYNPSNTVDGIIFANGNNMKLTYDLRDRVDTLVITDRNGSEIIKYNYDYDSAGNLTRHQLSPSDSFSYEYDKVYRLTRAEFPSEDDSEYSYDPAGNRTSLKYAYGDVEYFYEPKSNQLDYFNVNLHGKVDYTHDKNGNLIREDKIEGGEVVRSVEYKYDPEDRLIQIKLSQSKIDNVEMPDLEPKVINMVYDANGMRVKKTVNGGTTLYHYDLANNVLCETDENGQVKATYVYANGMRIASVLPDGNVQFFHNDPLGSPILISDEEGNAVQRYVYDPFGTVIVSKGENDNHYTYTGKEFDAGSGLMYYGARFYDPKIGRFITKDIAEPDYGNPQSLNRYVYCLNNPLVYVDPDGLDAILYVDRWGGFGLGHMGLYYQNPDGKWFRADLYAERMWFPFYSPGEFNIQPIEDAVIASVLQGNRNDFLYFKTTMMQDELVSQYLASRQMQFNLGIEKYDLLFNNCVYLSVNALQFAGAINSKVILFRKPGPAFDFLREQIFYNRMINNLNKIQLLDFEGGWYGQYPAPQQAAWN